MVQIGIILGFVILSLVTVVSLILGILSFQNRMPPRPLGDRQQFLVGSRDSGVRWSDKIGLEQTKEGETLWMHDALGRSTGTRSQKTNLLLKNGDRPAEQIGQFEWSMVYHQRSPHLRFWTMWGHVLSPVEIFAPGTGHTLQIELPTSAVANSDMCTIHSESGLLDEYVQGRVKHRPKTVPVVEIMKQKQPAELSLVTTSLNLRVSLSYTEHMESEERK